MHFFPLNLPNNYTTYIPGPNKGMTAICIAANRGGRCFPVCRRIVIRNLTHHHKDMLIFLPTGMFIWVNHTIIASSKCGSDLSLKIISSVLKSISSCSLMFLENCLFSKNFICNIVNNALLIVHVFSKCEPLCVPPHFITTGKNGCFFTCTLMYIKGQGGSRSKAQLKVKIKYTYLKYVDTKQTNKSKTNN